MTLVGKIFTMLILVLSIVFMAFSMMVFATHKNWKTTAAALQTKLTAANAANNEAKAELQRLQTDFAREQAARKAAIAALTVRATRAEETLTAKQNELATLASTHSQATAAAEQAQRRLATLEDETKKLRDDLRGEQKKRDQMFVTVIDLTDKLNQ